MGPSLVRGYDGQNISSQKPRTREVLLLLYQREVTPRSQLSSIASIFYKMPLSQLQLLSQLETNHNRRCHSLTDIDSRLADILIS